MRTVKLNTEAEIIAEMVRRIDGLPPSASFMPPWSLTPTHEWRNMQTAGGAERQRIAGWLADAETKINAEVSERVMNFMAYGTSHPEMLLPCSPNK